MFVDINANIGHWPFKKLRYNTCASLLKRMNQFGVDISVLSSLNGIFYKNTHSANEELYDEIRSDKAFAKRFIPFAIINPVYAGWRDDLHTCIKKMGMKGVRIYPQYHDYDVTEAPVIELVKMARDYDVPVAFTMRMVDSRQASWMDLPMAKEWNPRHFIPLMKEVPDAKYMFLNISNGMGVTGADKDFFKTTKYLIDTSGRSIDIVRDFLNDYGKANFAFGTHAPILDYLSGMLRIEYLNNEEATATEKEMLRSGNAKRFLKI